MNFSVRFSIQISPINTRMNEKDNVICKMDLKIMIHKVVNVGFFDCFGCCSVKVFWYLYVLPHLTNGLTFLYSLVFTVKYRVKIN